MLPPTPRLVLTSGLLLCCAVAALPAELHAQGARAEREIELVPREGMTFGSPYNTIREYAIPRSSCVEFTLSDSTTVLRGSTSQESFWKRIESNATMARHMNMSIGAHLKALTGGGTYESDSKVALLNETRSNSHSVNLFGSVIVKFPKLMLREGTYRLTDEALRLLEEEGERAFELRCGDAFVAGATRGYEFHARAHLKETSQDRVSEAKVKTDQNWDAAQYQISALFDRGKRLERSQEGSDFEIKVVRTDPYSRGVRTNPTTFEQLEEQFRGFMSNASTAPPMQQNFIRLHLVPYTLAANYPGEDFTAILDPPTRQDQLAEMIGALWDLKALREDAAFMREHPEEYAMGWRASTVEKWDGWLAGLQEDWLDEFQALRERARDCRAAGEGESDEWDSLKCSEIARAYNRDEGSRKLLAERDRLPDRKTSACSAPIPVDVSANSSLRWPNAPLGFLLSHTEGSNELQDGLPKVLRAELSVRVEEGGRLARLLVDGSLEDCKREDGRCRKDKKKWRTKLEGGTEMVLFDLDDGDSNSDAVSGMDQSAFADMSQCVYHEAGPLSTEPLRREGGRWIYGEVQETVAAKSVKHCRPGREGCMNPGQLAEVPADRKHRARGRGALRDLTCVIDLNDKRDRRLACEARVRGGLKLRLLNDLDIAAEHSDLPKLASVSLPHYSRSSGPPVVDVIGKTGGDIPIVLDGGGKKDGDEARRPRPGRTYKIRNVHTGKYLAVSGGHQRKGANVIQWKDAGQPDVIWRLRDGPGRTVRLQNAHSGKYLAISGGKRSRGQSVIQWSDVGQGDVRWVLVPAGDGTFRIRNRGTGRFLAVKGRDRSNGANVVQWSDRPGSAQRWRFVPAD